METLDKHELKRELVQSLAATLADLERAHAAAHEAATHEEAKPENDKDTRALEQSYLARGQAGRAQELAAAVARAQALPVRALGADDPISIGALVEVEDDGGEHRYFMAPEGGGTLLVKGRVLVVTHKSPLGAALIGRHVGDDLEVRIGARVRELTIVGVF